MLARRTRTLLLLAALSAGGGCTGSEPRFDLVPGPISTGILWLEGSRRPCSLEPRAWACIHDLSSIYQRDYLDLVRREAVPLVREFRAIRDEEWRRNIPLLERLIARHQSLLRALEILDEGFFAGLESCGLESDWVERMRTERRIEISSLIINGTGPPILDLRSLLPPRAAWTAEVAGELDRYARSLAELLPSLAEVERSRPVRHQRHLEQLMQERARDDPQAQPGRFEDGRLEHRLLAGVDEQGAMQPGLPDKVALESQAAASARAPIRRGLGRLLDLNMTTLERLRALMPMEAYEEILHRFREAVAPAAGGDPLFEWHIEVMAADASLPESARRSLLERLDRFREKDRAVMDDLLRTMRSGQPLPSSGPQRGERDSLRTELLGAALRLLPQAQRERLVQITELPPAEIEALISEIAPRQADRLIRRMPAALRRGSDGDDEAESAGLPQRPPEFIDVFLPMPTDEAALGRLLGRFNLDADQRVVAQQLWIDDATAALRALQPMRVVTKEAESAIGPALSDSAAIRRAIDAYFSAIDRERAIIAAAEERYLDALGAVVAPADLPLVEQLRLERRVARERIDWRFVLFGESLGFSPEAAVSAIDVIAHAEIEPHEREIAESLLESRLPDLAAEAGAFREEGLNAIRRLGAAIAQTRDRERIGEVLPTALASIASGVRPSVDRHIALHLEAIDEIARALPQTSLALRRAWRRLAFPELFTADPDIRAAISLAQRRVAGDEERSGALQERVERFELELDAAEELVMSARRSTTFNQAPTRRREVRDQLRTAPELAAAVAFRRETQLRLLGDLACLSGDPALLEIVATWAHPPRPTHFRIYED